jgi:hypothetical protein
MQSEIKHKYIIHIIYASTFLLAVFLVIGYMFWEKERASIAALEAQRNAEKVAEAKADRAKTCVMIATSAYTELWAKACIKQAETIKTALNNCIAQAHYDTALIYSWDQSAQKNAYLSRVILCKNMYGSAPNPAPDCKLPAYEADDLNNQLLNAKSSCYNDPGI